MGNCQRIVDDENIVDFTRHQLPFLMYLFVSIQVKKTRMSKTIVRAVRESGRIQFLAVIGLQH